MPGVPASRACNACRKQRKKCDERKPTCLRCEKLGVQCLGSGLQRYKFLTVNGERIHGTTRLLTAPERWKSPSPVTVPQNATMGLVAAFLDKLSIDDARYDLSFTFGPLMREIPKRLGESTVLDSSVSALVATVSELVVNKPPQEGIRRFCFALYKLRMSLQDPETAFSPLSLCAIHVIWICQGWVGGDHRRGAVGHGAGVLKLLSRTHLRFSDDYFDKILLGTVLSAVMYEATFDSRLKPDPWIKQFLLGNRAHHLDARSCLLNLPDMMQYNPSMVPTVSEYYDAILDECQRLINNADENVSHDQFTLLQKIRCRKLNVLALNSGMAIILNGILLAYEPDNIELRQMSLQLHNQIISLSAQAEQWIPFGAAWIPIVLELFWVAQDDPKRRSEVKMACEEHWTRFTGEPLNITKQFESTFDKLRLDAINSRRTFRH